MCMARFYYGAIRGFFVVTEVGRREGSGGDGSRPAAGGRGSRVESASIPRGKAECYGPPLPLLKKDASAAWKLTV